MAHIHDPGLSHSRRQHPPERLSTLELARMLREQERESRDLDKLLSDATDALKREVARSAEAERRARDIARRIRATEQARAQSEATALRSAEELALYKAQLSAAQQEIFRAQEYLDQETEHRQDAEVRATTARSEARKLKEEKLIALAREEGRRLGLVEGLKRGRVAGIQEGRDSAMRDQSEVDGSDGERTQRAESPRAEAPLIISVVDAPPAETPPPSRPASVSTRPPTVPPQPPQPPSPPQDQEIHPIIVHGPPTTSYQHPHVEVPPDGWVPVADANSHIVLPPPHELETPPASSRVPSRPLSTDQPVLMVPPPGQSYADSGPRAPSAQGRDTRRHRRRRSSLESDSTTFSQLDIISPPEVDVRGRQSLVASRSSRAPTYERDLSVIPEASPAYTRESLAQSQAFDSPPAPQPMSYPVQPPPPQPQPVIPPMQPPPPIVPVQQPVQVVIPQSYSRHEWDDRGLRPPSVGRGYASSSGRSSITSSFVDISVVPPSRSPSNMSVHTEMPTFGALLSPEDANRPLPPIISSEPEAPFIPPVFPTVQYSEAPSMFAPLSDSGGSAPIFLPSGNLPAGFIPTSPIVPGPMPSYSHYSGMGTPSMTGWGAQPHRQEPEEAVYESPVIPPKMEDYSDTSSSSGAGHPSGYYANHSPPRRSMYSSDDDPPPVPVPAPVPTATPYYMPQTISRPPTVRPPTSQSRRSRYSRDSDSGSEISSSLGSNATLTTPPPRAPRSPLVPLANPPLEPGPTPPPLPVPYGGSRQSRYGSEAGRTSHSAAYDEAPLPPNVMYPDPRQPIPVPPPSGPPRPRSAATARSGRTAQSTGSRAAGVPLPPSTAGDSPRSAAGSLAGSAAASEYSQRGWATHAGNTPGMRLGTIDEGSAVGSAVGSMRGWGAPPSAAGGSAAGGWGQSSAAGSRKSKGRSARSRYTTTAESDDESQRS